MNEPFCKTKLMNGVWRVKHHPTDSSLLLTATMHGGFHVLKYESLTSSLNVSLHYQKHTSLGYGVDWSLEDNLIASCSFYDHYCTLWKYKI